MEIFSILLALSLGVIGGLICGTLPGFHTNTVAVIIAASAGALSKIFPPLSLGVFLVSMSVVNAFLEIVPAVFLGAPDPTTCLSVLPGHELLFKGEGYKAVTLSVIGGLGVFIVGIPIIILLFFCIKPLESFLKVLIPFILIGFSALFILKEKGLRKRIWALIIFLTSGVLGLIVLSCLDIKEPLFPLFSGAFGISSLLLSLGDDNKVPPQTTECKIEFWKNLPNYLKAAFSSLLVSLLPGVGSAQAAGVAQGFTKFNKREDFLVIVGGINTAGCIFTMSALFLTQKARSGVMASLNQIMSVDFNTFLVLIAASLCAGGFGAYLSLKFAKAFAKGITKINYKLISLIIIIFVSVLILLFSGWLGLLVLSVSTAIGLLAPLIGVRRIHAMGLLVVPILIYFL